METGEHKYSVYTVNFLVAMQQYLPVIFNDNECQWATCRFVY